MGTRIKQFMLVAMLGVVLSIVFAGTASAEQCVYAFHPPEYWNGPPPSWYGPHENEICLVTDTSQPWQPGQQFLLKIPSEDSKPGVSPGLASLRLVTRGPPEGFSVWEGVLGPSREPVEKQIDLFVESRISPPGCMACEKIDFLEAHFFPLLLGNMVNPKTTIRRAKKRVVAFYDFDARTTVMASVDINLNSFDSEDAILFRREVKREVGPGHQVLKVVLNRKKINRLCRTHGHCSVLASGMTKIMGPREYETIDQGTYDRKTLVTHRKKIRHKKHQKHRRHKRHSQ